MKLTRLFFLLLSLCVVVACDDDDDDNGSSNDSLLVGEWRLVSNEYSGGSSVNTGALTTNTEFTGFAKDIDFTMRFTEDPNNWDVAGGYVVELTTVTPAYVVYGIEIPASTTTQDLEISDVVSNGNWTLEGNDLIGFDVQSTTVDQAPGTTSEVTYTIVTLTDSTLEMDFTGTTSSTQDGAVVTSSSQGTVILDRM